MEIKRRQGVTLIKVGGTDLADPVKLHQSVEAAILAEGDRKLLVDLSEVTYMNSSQIGAVVGLHVLAYENLAVIKFVGVCERIAALFKLVGVDTLLDMHYARTASALESFGAYNPEDWTDLPDARDPSGQAQAPVRDGPPASG